MTANELIAICAETAVAEINKRIEQLAANVSSLRSDVSLRRGKSAFIVYFTGACMLALVLFTPKLVGFFSIQPVLGYIALYSLCLYLGVFFISNVILLLRKSKVLSNIMLGDRILNKLNQVLSAIKNVQTNPQPGSLLGRGKVERLAVDWDELLEDYQKKTVTTLASEPNRVLDYLGIGLYWVVSILLNIWLLMSTAGWLAGAMHNLVNFFAGALTGALINTIYYISGAVSYYFIQKDLNRNSSTLGPGSMALSLLTVPAAMIMTFLAAGLLALSIIFFYWIWRVFARFWFLCVVLAITIIWARSQKKSNERQRERNR